MLDRIVRKIDSVRDGYRDACRSVLASIGHRKRPLARRSPTIYYCADADRGYFIGGKAYAQILDSFRLAERNSAMGECITLAPLGSRLVGLRAYGEVEGPSLIYSLFYILVFTLDCLTLKTFNWRLIVAVEYYSRKIRELGCVRIVGIQPPESMIMAADRLGVEVFDLQHGDIAPGVPYYEYFCRRCDGMKFLVWDEETRSVLSRDFLVDSGRVVVVGNPWVDIHRNAEKADLLRLGETAVLPLHDIGSRKKVLVTLQYGLRDSYPENFDNEYIPRSLGRAILNSKDITWILRPHPVKIRDSEYVSSLISEFSDHGNVLIADSKDTSLPALLKMVDLHVTWHSSSTIDAKLIGIPSLVLCTQPYIYSRTSDATGVGRPPYYQYQGSSLITWAHGDEERKYREIMKFVR